MSAERTLIRLSNTMSDTQCSPRADHTSLPTELWLEIFRYATYVPRARCISPRESFEIQRPFNPLNTPVSSMRTKCSLVLVCQGWRRVSTELLYEHVVINSSRRAYLLGRTLESSDLRAAIAGASTSATSENTTSERGHARWIRHLEIHTCSRTSKTAPFWYAIAGILSMLPNLHAVSGFWERPLSKGMLDVFTRYLGESVRALYWEEGEVPAGEASLLAPTFLTKYRSLRVLDIRKLAFENSKTVPELGDTPVVLPGVIDLLIPMCPAIMAFATKLSLPALARLVLDASTARTRRLSAIPPALDTLLAVHGPKLTTVELLPVNSLSYASGPVDITTFLQPDVCPQLDTLVFDCRERVLSAPVISALQQPPQRPPAKSLFSPLPPPTGPPPSDSAPPLNAPHAALRRVGIRGMGISRLYPNRPTHAQLHLRAFAEQRELFPALEVVRTLGFLVDASTDPFARDIFIWWTEKYESAGLDLQDGEGVVWLYTDPECDESAATEEQLMAADCVDYVHKSDVEQYNLAKAQA
ncbi:hypothetical protein SCP_0301990 [Sparassis crispa]|uniref:Uncharacterized protein n=1 Tax=Sparassis crispa TaxID=139825 RepID=A0A401GE72_9APHY|nr:hypothetical protein SCP_0301990 [Sparassis crispa]GBE80484.1 hypothetical protein SCP_0301990 [Sparassis crispa]